MKRFFVLGGSCILALVVSSAVCVAKGKGNGAMTVQVRSAIVRATPNYLGAAVGTLTYGQQVNIVGEEGNWYKIDVPSGYIPKNDVTSHKVAVNPDQKFSGSGARHDEVALAGKGFNPQVEQQFKRDNPNLAIAFSQVDKIETINVTDAQLKAFQSSGKLVPR